MTVWLILAALTVVAVALLVWPLMRRRDPAADRADYDLEVYKDQLAEVERDQARGVLAEAEAEAARTEIARRMLSADAAREDGSAASAAPSDARATQGWAMRQRASTSPPRGLV